MVEIVQFSKYARPRARAHIKAREMVEFLKEKCEPSAIPEGMTPDALMEQITNVFYEAERLKEWYAKGKWA